MKCYLIREADLLRLRDLLKLKSAEALAKTNDESSRARAEALIRDLFKDVHYAIESWIREVTKD